MILSDALGDGVDAISIVENPAIEENFVYLSKGAERVVFNKVSDEQRIVVGAALIPNMPIYRDMNGDEFYVYFTSDTVKQVAHKFIAQGRQGQATIEHAVRVSGVSVVESWVVEDESRDKALAYGLKAPKGAWMVMMKINNDAVWEDYVKTGKVKGFSIEGFFSKKSVSARAQLKRIIA
jgi:hypothetical protein